MATAVMRKMKEIANTTLGEMRELHMQTYENMHEDRVAVPTPLTWARVEGAYNKYHSKLKARDLDPKISYVVKCKDIDFHEDVEKVHDPDSDFEDQSHLKRARQELDEHIPESSEYSERLERLETQALSLSKILRARKRRHLLRW